MSLSSQGARVAALCLRRPLAPQIPRRYASHGAEHEHGHGAGESALHVDAGVKSGGEGFGKGFYISLALVPLSYFIYVTASAKQNPIERFVDNYILKTEVENEKNALHSRMIEQALADRSLFRDSAVSFAGPSIRYPEGMNAGSPMNIVAGQGSADMNELMQHYIEERRRADANGNERRRILEEKR